MKNVAEDFCARPQKSSKHCSAKVSSQTDGPERSASTGLRSAQHSDTLGYDEEKAVAAKLLDTTAAVELSAKLEDEAYSQLVREEEAADDRIVAEYASEHTARVLNRMWAEEPLLTFAAKTLAALCSDLGMYILEAHFPWVSDHAARI